MKTNVWAACKRLAIVSLCFWALGAPLAMSQNISASQLSALRFRFVGPKDGNRVSAVVGVPGNPNIYYVGAAAGGVWKSTDGGFHFRPIFDQEPVQSIGTLALDPRHPSTVWVGTGESWIIRNGITPGDGVYRSSDGGRSWQHLGLADTGTIARIIVNPRDSNNVFVCAEGTGTRAEKSRGVWRTEDGGKTWKQVLFVNGDTGCSGLTMDPEDPAILFAGMWQFQLRPWQMNSGGASSAVYMSRDGGNTWANIESHGLPHSPVGKIDVAIAPSDPQRVYALIQTWKQGSLWRSDDGGRQWHVVNYDRLLTERAGYSTRLAVSPADEDRIYVASNSFYLSEDGGLTFQEIPAGGDNHDIWIDPRNANRIVDTSDGGISISTTGGRNWRRVSFPIGQMYHVSVDNQIPYFVYSNMQDDTGLMGPAYPYSTPGIFESPQEQSTGWHDVGGCESGFTYPDPSNPDIVWSTCYADEVTRLDTRVGYPRAVSPWPEHPMDAAPQSIKYRCHWSAPLAIDPFDHHKVYYGCQVIFETDNGGQSWKVISPDLSTQNPKYLVGSGGLVVDGVMHRQDNLGQFYGEVVFAIAPSPVQPSLIWAGTNDGQVWLTRDGGGHWDNVTKNIPDLPPWGAVERIEPSHFDAGTAYLAVDRTLMGDSKPYIYKTSDFGHSWKLIVKGIPMSPESSVSSVAQDPYSKNLLFAGTGNALYVSLNDGGNWIPLQSGLPHAPVSWETVQKTFHDLVVSTYGRGIYVLEDITPLEQLAAESSPAPVQVFNSRPAYRFFQDAHAWIDFYLRSKPKNKVTVSILDSQGALVRRLTLSPTPPSNSAQSPLQAFTRSFYRRPSGGTELQAGLNRVSWDLRYAPPKLIALRTTPASNPQVWNTLRFMGQTSRPITHWGIYGGEIGPMAAPGNYTVRVAVDGKTYDAPLRILADPRALATQTQTEAVVKTLLHIRDDITTVSDTVNRIEWLRLQLQTIENALHAAQPAKATATLVSVKDMDHKLLAIEDQLLSPGLANSDHKTFLGKDSLYLHYLWLSAEIGTGGGDVLGNPGYTATDASMQVLRNLDAKLAAATSQFDSLMQNQLPAFNRALANNGVTPIVPPAAAASGRN